MKQHWKVLAWLVAGVLVGIGMQAWVRGEPWSGARFEDGPAGGARVVSAAGPAAASGLAPGDLVVAAVLGAGTPRERRVEIAGAAELEELVAGAAVGDLVRLETDAGRVRMVAIALDPASPRAKAIAPFDFAASLFMALLKMLIVPLVLSSIVAGVASVGELGDLRRLGLKTFGYYVSTSLFAILVGQALVTIVRPGEGAKLGLTRLAEDEAPRTSFVDVVGRAVPENVFAALADNGAMLQIIFFALLLGFFLTRTPDPWRERVLGPIEAFFQVMLRMASGVLTLLPYGVFALMVRVSASTGIAVFRPLLVFMAVVTTALLIHACVVLPLIVRVVGGISPLRWAKAISPALMTAFSTSSSSMTLPVTLETVERRGRVSNRVTSFVLPLGATINMDGTALYECVAVIFLAQYYGTFSTFELTPGTQVLVVVMALLASIGAAGIPSAGLVMMLTILATLGLPLEGAALLLAIDRPLDMLRTVVNVWSDACGAAVVARTEGEDGPLLAGAAAP